MADSTPAPGTAKLTPELRASLCKELSDGVDRRHACQLVGIGLRTLQRWLAAGRERKAPAPFVALVAQVKKAEAEAVSFHVAHLRKASEEGTWQASAWWLERRHPDIYGSDRKRVRELERLVAELVKGAVPAPAAGDRSAKGDKRARKPADRRPPGATKPRAGDRRDADSRP
jgi:hypothetical protein